jgi:hypothetical protein
MFSDVFSDHMFYEIIDFIHPIVDFKNGFQNLSFYEIQTLLFFPIKVKDYKTALCYTRMTILYIFTFDIKKNISVDKDIQNGFKKNFGKIL